MDNLPDLRDIHIPDGVSIFPPAYGWWLMLLFILFLAFSYHFYKKYKHHSKKLYALRLLNNIREDNAINNAKAMSELLRRICVAKYPQAVVFFGRQWIDFLNAHSSKTLDAKTADLLIDAPYMPSSSNLYNIEDAELLRNFCQYWIGEKL